MACQLSLNKSVRILANIEELTFIPFFIAEVVTLSVWKLLIDK